MMYALGYTDAASALLDAGFALPNDRAAAWAQAHAGDLIAGIDQTTRDELRDLIANAESDPTVTQADVAAQVSELFSGYADWRADMIARTELVIAANSGQISGFRDTGIEYVEVSDGEEFDEPCVAADGAIWTLDDAEANPLQHPGCGRSFSAIDSADVNPDDVSTPED